MKAESDKIFQVHFNCLFVMKIKLVYLLTFLVLLLGWRIFYQVRANNIAVIDNDYYEISNHLANDSGIVAILIPNKTYYRLGEKPDMDLILLNRTDSVVYLPGSLDGSAIPTRLPYCDYIVQNRKVKRKYWIDANPNPLINEDLVRLEPNEYFNAFDNLSLLIKDYGYDSLLNTNNKVTKMHDFWSPFNFGHKSIIWPGRYDIQVVYSTKNDTSFFAGWNLSDRNFNSNYLDSIPEIYILSNAVSIRYSLF
jgi:hypothetical protein